MVGRQRASARKGRRRLSRSAEFDRVYRKGRSSGGRFLVFYGFQREQDGGQVEEAAEDRALRLGVSVGRRVGGAVERNKVKRLTREAFWALQDQLPAGFDYVVVARADALGLAEREGLEGFQRELLGLVEKLGWLQQTDQEEAESQSDPAND